MEHTLEVSTCPLTALLEYWDEGDRVWREYSEWLTNHGQREQESSWDYSVTFMHNDSGTSGNPITFDVDNLDYVSGHKA